MTIIQRGAAAACLIGVVAIAGRARAETCGTTTDYSCYRYTTDEFTTPATNWFSAGGNLEWNYVYVPAHPAAGPKLLLFLAGTGGEPTGYNDFMKEAATRGYYVIGLPYRNQIHTPDLCGYWPGCAGFYYQQNVDGYDNGFFAHDAANGVTPAANSITYRFGMLLSHLLDDGVASAQVDWGTFWDYSAAYSPGPGIQYNGAPYWSKMVVAGHSQGGETTTWITKNKPTIAGLTFAAPYATMDDDHDGDDPNDTTADGPPHHMQPINGTWTNVTSWYTGWATSGGTRCDTCYAKYLDPTTWPAGRVNRLFIMTDSHDPGYPADGKSWLGHSMVGVGNHLGKNETTGVNSCPSQLASRWNTTDYVSTCGGHNATIVDNCTPSWIRCFWDLELDRALTL